MTLRMLGISPVSLNTNQDGGFLPSVDDCAKLITAKTKAVVMCTPNNPVRTRVFPAPDISSDRIKRQVRYTRSP